MKTKFLISAALLAFAASSAFAAKPKLMVMPDNTWMVTKGYYTEKEHNGKTRKIYDYDKAFVDPDYTNVRTAISGVMAERGYPLVDASTQSESDEEEEMFDEMYDQSTSGSTTKMTGIDQLVKDAKPDIFIKVGWNVNEFGTLHSAEFRLTAVDVYSNKEVVAIAGNTGEKRRSIPISTALKESASENMENFTATLNNYFDDLQTNGREIRLNVTTLDSSPVDLKSEFGGKELTEIIYNWVSDNTVNHQFSERSASRNQVRYDQVRIPLFDANGRPLTASGWVRQLKKYLQSSYDVPCAEASPALGRGRLIIGEK